MTASLLSGLTRRKLSALRPYSYYYSFDFVVARHHGRRTVSSLVSLGSSSSSSTCRYQTNANSNSIISQETTTTTTTKKTAGGASSSSSFSKSLSKPFLLVGAALTAAAGGVVSSTSSCEKKTQNEGGEGEGESNTTTRSNNNNNPLWPNGCNEKDIESFVNEVMKDPTINIPQLPDSVERIIYKSTTRLVLNIVYYMLSRFHGFTALEHQLILVKKKKQVGGGGGYEDEQSTKFKGGNNNNNNNSNNRSSSSSRVDEAILERVADQMLSNKAINLQLVPDIIERQLYINSLRLVFRLLDILASSFNLKVCGHSLSLDFTPSLIEKTIVQQQQQQHPEEKKWIATSSSSQSSSSSSSRSLPLLLTTDIDMNKIRHAVRKHVGIREETIHATELSFLQRWSIPEEFIIQLHTSIYGLVLGIVDDVLANTQITLLSDQIVLDIIPFVVEEEKENELSVNADENNKNKSYNDGGVGSGFDARSFVLGCGVGLTAAAAVLAAGR